MIKTIKEKMIDELLELLANNEDFLFNEMEGMDVMMGAFIIKFRKMKKEELEMVYKKAKSTKV